MVYQLSKFNTESLFILFADCMHRLLRSEGFHAGRHIKVSSEHDDFGDRRRVVEHGFPWCTSSGNRFGEWVQVDLSKYTYTYFQGLAYDFSQLDYPRTVIGLVQNYRRISLGLSSN